MAKYTKTCIICGKKFTVNLFGNHKKRKWQLEQYTCCGDIGEDCQERSPDLDWAR